MPFPTKRIRWRYISTKAMSHSFQQRFMSAIDTFAIVAALIYLLMTFTLNLFPRVTSMGMGLVTFVLHKQTTRTSLLVQQHIHILITQPGTGFSDPHIRHWNQQAVMAQGLTEILMVMANQTFCSAISTGPPEC